MSLQITVNKRSQKLATDQYREWKDKWLRASKNHSSSFFLSWPWIEHWLCSIPLDIEIYFMTIEGEGANLACFFGHTDQVRHYFINSKAYYLNYTGHEFYDNITLEYNQIPGIELSKKFLQAIISALPGRWDEIYFPALDKSSFPANCLNIKLPNIKTLKFHETPSHYLKLKHSFIDIDNYLKSLSSNSRNQLRRSIRKLEKLGNIHIFQANSLESAVSTFDSLVELHQKYWIQKGWKGAFYSDWFTSFHRDFIKKRFEHGDIQLLRCSAGDHVIGYLYNFVHNRNVLYYQSGFNYLAFREFKPGLVSHAMAINHNAILGNNSYDFLAGDSQYKKSLATHQRKQVWYVLQKECLKFELENLAKKLFRK